MLFGEISDYDAGLWGFGFQASSIFDDFLRSIQKHLLGIHLVSF